MITEHILEQEDLEQPWRAVPGLSEHYESAPVISGIAESRSTYQPIRRFEDLVAWQKARALVKEVYLLTSHGAFARDFRLSSQLQSAAVSAMSNVSEGHERTGINTYLHFLSIARGSCGEVRSLLYVSLDIGYLEQAKFEKLYVQAVEIGKLISGLIASLEKARIKT